MTLFQNDIDRSGSPIEGSIFKNMTSVNWQRVNRELLAKMLREFAYEGLIAPQIKSADGSTTTGLELSLQKGAILYRYQGIRRVLGDYQIDPGSIHRWVKNREEGREVEEDKGSEISPSYRQEGPVEACQFFLEVYPEMEVRPFTATYFIKELQNTLLSDMHLLEKLKERSAQQLAQMTYEDLECFQSGHPWLVVSKGRFGLNYEDHLHYAPESHQVQRLHWVAVERERVQTYLSRDLKWTELLAQELGLAQVQEFEEKLLKMDLDPQHYTFFPIQEWQWKNIIIPQFVGEIAQRRIVSMGPSADTYLPQQAIRTLSPMKGLRPNKDKFYVKMTMTIFNTAVYRGIPHQRVEIAPVLSDWLLGLHRQDHFLNQECDAILLGEVAGLTYQHPYFHKVQGPPYQFIESMAVIWRENLNRYLKEGEQALALGALLQRDAEGRSLILELVRQSGMSLKEWVKSFHQVVLWPLLHFLYQYGVAFNAHGQNLILVHKKGVPQRLCIKDFSDDVNICELPYPQLQDFPEVCRPIVLQQPPEILQHFIYSSLFICHDRYMSDVLLNEVSKGTREQDPRFTLTEEEFWGSATAAIEEYQKRFPHLQERFQSMDLLAPQMIRVCLNRVRALTYGYADDSGRPEPATYGMVENPLARTRGPSA